MKRKLRLHVVRKVEMPAAGKPDDPEGGLFHDAGAFPGTEAFNVYSDSGTRLGRWVAIEGVTDDAFHGALLDLLSRQPNHLGLVS